MTRMSIPYVCPYRVGNQYNWSIYLSNFSEIIRAGLAQSVERQALNLMVEGSSPSVGVYFFAAKTTTSSTPPTIFFFVAAVL